MTNNMDQLTRIEKLLERIAVSLEKQDKTFEINSDTVIGPGLIDIKDGSLSDWKEAIDKYVAGGRTADAVRPPHPFGPCRLDETFGIDYCMMGDDKTSETCRAKFDNMMNFGVEPHISDDRHLTKEEAHALNRAVKRSTIKAHEGKLEKDK